MDFKGGELPCAKVNQIGVIVRDMDKAIEYFEALGIGPFKPLERTYPTIEREVYGKPANEVKNLIRVAHVGELEFELLQPISGDSIQKEFLETRGEGINHLGFFVDDLNKTVDQLVGRGFKVISRTKRANGGGTAYLDTDKVGGVQFEFVQF